ncbi:T1SS secreted agglutinin RTX [Caballeronia sordidicola]|uniref:T1SS secreted agglutinin RTX n=1 Tax=Caballeronia sordidicola TaxID=196367 RepID=A0A242MR59_CABSO|nr:T1SS secreted agglutinin RTX [Caballeronia sordidicola]
MIGFGHAGDAVFIFDGKSQIGSTIVHADGTWVFTTPALLSGRHDFSVGVIDPVNGGTLTSNHLAVQVFADAHPAPTTVATITSALDEFIDPAGNHHDNVIQNGGKTFDTSPKLLGTLNVALNAGETLVVYRDGVKLGLADVSGLDWSFQDMGVAVGEHTYKARVESAPALKAPTLQASESSKRSPTLSINSRCCSPIIF